MTNLNKSQAVLLQMLIVLAAVASVIIWQYDYLADLYIRNQVTRVGLIVNISIMALFVAGLSQLVRLFLLYGREEKALKQFSDAVSSEDVEHQLDQIPEGTIIGQRYRIVSDFFSTRTEFNHNALAATLLAQEASRTSFAKFVNNILILTGVFGTIISLTVALLGASTAISDANSLRGIDIVIHGMSTALSTTMTAILAYFLFGYFYLKLLDTQSYVLGKIEHITATVLVPRYQAATRSPEQNLSAMLAGTVETINKFDTFIRQIQEISAKQDEVFANFEKLTDQNMHLLTDIRGILRAGFRLRDESDKN
ncbi:MAG: hypothetical protein OXI60_11135 [Acidiferrobacterales bacterium]|nr:hypothetical protein [Acidiferrobacterales bacterium]